MQQIELRGKVAIVSGASRGIGKAICETLFEAGMNLAMVGRDREALEKLSQSLGGGQSRLLTISADLSLRDAPGRIVKRTAEHFGGVDVLVNNAGMALSARIEETSAEMWDRIMTVNAKAPFLLCKESLPFLRQSSCPAILNIASVVATKGYIHQAAYAASKHALLGFTKVLARETFQEGIRVHVISPGGVRTDMVTGMRPDIDTSDLIAPEEIADMVLFLLSRRGNAMIDELSVRRSTKEPWQ